LDGAGRGALAAPAQLPQEAADVVGVVLDAEASVDDMGHALGGPQIGGNPLRGRPLLQQDLEFLELFGGQSGRSPRLGCLLEGSQSAGLPGRLPAHRRLAGNATLAGDVGGQRAALKESSRFESPAFEQCKVPFLSLWKSHIPSDMGLLESIHYIMQKSIMINELMAKQKIRDINIDGFEDSTPADQINLAGRMLTQCAESIAQAAHQISL